jgi:hypothetical protein
LIPQPTYPSPAVHRQGKLLFIPRITLGNPASAPLPPLCVKCGAPSTSLLKRNLYWHEPWVYVLILPGLLIYAIAAVAMRKQLEVNVPLCGAHRAGRRKAILAAWLIALGGIALTFVFGAAGWNMGVAALLAFVMVLTGGVVGSVVSSPIKPRRIDDYGGLFVGCGEDFLRHLP